MEYSYSVVYVLTDAKLGKYYNELMKSLLTLKMYMSECRVAVLTDAQTYDAMVKQKAEALELAEIKTIAIPDGYNEIEKSRYLKVHARDFISGDMLFVDTDTVFCRAMPDIISTKMLAAVYDLNLPLERADNAELIMKACDIDLRCEHYYNSGLIWCCDVPEAHEFYAEWAELWEKTRKTGYHYDQPAFNRIFDQNHDMCETLPGQFNCQIGALKGTPMHCFADAYLVHYYHTYVTPYKFCNPEFMKLDYRDEAVQEALRHPLLAFDPCSLIIRDDNNTENIQKALKLVNTPLYKFLKFVYHHSLNNSVSDSILKRLFKRGK